MPTLVLEVCVVVVPGPGLGPGDEGGPGGGQLGGPWEGGGGGEGGGADLHRHGVVQGQPLHSWVRGALCTWWTGMVDY